MEIVILNMFTFHLMSNPFMKSEENAASHGFCNSSSKKIPLQCQSSSEAGSTRSCKYPPWKRELFKVSDKRLKGEKVKLELI